MKYFALLAFLLVACGPEPTETCRLGLHTLELVDVQDGCEWGPVGNDAEFVNVEACGPYEYEDELVGINAAAGCHVAARVTWNADALAFEAELREIWTCPDRTCERVFTFQLEAAE